MDFWYSLMGLTVFLAFLVGVMMEKYKMHSVWHPNSTSLCGWGLTKTWPLEGLISNKAHVC